MRSWTEASASGGVHANQTTILDGIPSALRGSRAGQRPTEAIASLRALGPRATAHPLSRVATPAPRSPWEDRLSSALDRGDPIPGTAYVIRRYVGEGGMGEVYEAEHRELGRRCALKILHRHHASRADLAARMRREARSLARLRHANLVDVFDLGITADGRPYFAMELLLGRDLRAELVRLGVVAVPTALEIVAQALDGLVCVHDAGIVHRDLKLENLFWCDSGLVKILDLGVAKLLCDGPAPSRRGIVGTPRTMAPEQFALTDIDPRADLYAIGVVLFELIAGRGPFDELDGDPQALRFAHCARPAPAPSDVAPQPIPPNVDAAVMRALAKSPSDRFQSAAEMAEALRALRGERRRKRAPPPASPLLRCPRRGAVTPAPQKAHLAIRALASGALVVALVALVIACVTAICVRMARAPAVTGSHAAPPATRAHANLVL